MTQSHENEATIFSDRKGNPVNTAEEAHIIEVTQDDGTHVILAKRNKDGVIEDPFKPSR